MALLPRLTRAKHGAVLQLFRQAKEKLERGGGAAAAFHVTSSPPPTAKQACALGVPKMGETHMSGEMAVEWAGEDG